MGSGPIRRGERGGLGWRTVTLSITLTTLAKLVLASRRKVLQLGILCHRDADDARTAQTRPESERIQETASSIKSRRAFGRAKANSSPSNSSSWSVVRLIKS